MQATIMTDPGTADRTYIGPMSAELVEEILEKVLQACSTLCVTAMSQRHKCGTMCVSVGAARCCSANHGRANFTELGQGTV